MSYAQTNSPDPLVNLALTKDATLSGNAPEGGRGIPSDILWDPSTNDWATDSEYHEYGMAYDDIMVATKDDPLYWQVVWDTPKNINYITYSGVYPNQPQPTTGWSVQIMVDSNWQDLAKAHDGWNADTLRGAGVGIPTQTNWLWDGQLVWRGLEPVVTRGIRFIAYANPDSLTDGKDTFADSLWSFAWSGRDFGPGTPKAALIQYLDYSDTEADNKLDPLINLALLDEAVVSTNFQEGDFDGLIRNQPVDIVYDPVKDDYHNKNTTWGEFGYPYGYDAGYPEGPDDGFQYIIEWPVQKKINFFTWGGCYAGTPQPNIPWAVQYWNGEAWETLIDGVGGSFMEGDTAWPYTPGVDADAQSIWMVPVEDAISTNKIRLVAWSDGETPLWSFAIRCRGGSCYYVDDSENPFKAILVQYAEIHDPTAIKTRDLVQPTAIRLYQNYPNPFNPKTIINYELRMTNDVELSIYNSLGQKVATLVSDRKEAGWHQVEWDASGFSSGIYYCRLSTEAGFVQTRKLVLIK
jgi:hypothetical protein